MKKLLIIGGAAVVILGIAALVFRDALGSLVLRATITPGHSFAADTVSPPDYTRDAFWAALPHRHDAADVSASAAHPDLQRGAPVDVFFVHPTTYYRADHWNQPLDHAPTNAITDVGTMAGQASAYNGCCSIYAPRYRQATLAAFFDGDGDDGERALALAYGDVLNAFEAFLIRNQSRPFILAGHSQGAKHLERLIAEEITGTPLLDRMVAAYPIGFFFSERELARRSPDVPVCRNPTDTHCLVTWNAVSPDGLQQPRDTGGICVNPLSWRTDGRHVAHHANLGVVQFGRLDSTLRAGGGNGLPAPAIVPGGADAQCQDGALVVRELRTDIFDDNALLARGNYHIIDYSLFYLNLRANAQARVRAYLQARGL